MSDTTVVQILSDFIDKHSARKSAMSVETAFAHLEAFITGGDEMGEVPVADASTALDAIKAERATLLEQLNKVKADYEKLAEYARSINRVREQLEAELGLN